MSTPLAGEIRMFAGNYAPPGWAFCNGQQLSIDDHPALYNVIGATYGGDGKATFALPDMRGRIPVHRGAGIRQGEAGGSEIADLTHDQLPGHSHTTSPASGATSATYAGSMVNILADSRPISALNGSAADYAAGGNSAHDNVQPYLCIHFIIALTGDMEPVSMLEQFVGEVRLFAGAFAPRGWHLCNGQSLPVDEHTELFSVLGTTFGGDGRGAFSLPDLRGRVSMHAGQGDGLTLRRLGEAGGSEAVALSESHLPYHSHDLMAAPDVNAVANTVVVSARGSGGPGPGWTTISGQTVSAGAGEPHNNLQPYLALNYIIAATGNTTA